MSKFFSNYRKTMDELPPAMQTYVRVTGPAIALYTVALLFWGASHYGFPVPRWMSETFAVATAAGLVVHIWSLLHGVQGADEFMRTVIAKRLIAAAMITIGGATIWGFFHELGWAVEFPLPLLYLAPFVLNLLLMPFINADRS